MAIYILPDKYNSQELTVALKTAFGDLIEELVILDGMMQNHPDDPNGLSLPPVRVPPKLRLEGKGIKHQDVTAIIDAHMPAKDDLEVKEEVIVDNLNEKVLKTEAYQLLEARVTALEK